jgi:arylsulfatase A-like enzyme
VLKSYGYATAAFGKWHNTPAEETTAAGPFENWPAGLGFEYFYGFLAGGGVAVRTEPGAQYHGGPAARDDRGP